MHAAEHCLYAASMFLASEVGFANIIQDTINHVLDFSKINSFEKNWRLAQKTRRGSMGRGNVKRQTKSPQPGGPALLNIYARQYFVLCNRCMVSS